jgi:hypothetical protein
VRYIPLIIVQNNPDIKEKIKILKGYFPRLIIYSLKDIITQNEVIIIILSSVQLTIREKKLFLSILYSILNKEIILFKRYIFSTIYQGSPLYSFYDFTKNQFHYTKDLFQQFEKYVKNSLRNKIQGKSGIPDTRNYLDVIWNMPRNNSINDLVNNVNSRVQRENLQFHSSQLKSLTNFFNKLNFKNLINGLDNDLFQQYIKSLQLIPSFNEFGFSQFYLIFKSFDPDKLDLRLLLTNSFNDIELPCEIQDSLTNSSKNR